ICRNIILELGGKLELESQQGQGASFRIVLPAAGSDASMVRRAFFCSKNVQKGSGYFVRSWKLLVFRIWHGVCLL
ncbi:MAG: hypothetical protein R6V08_04095, partial [Desulfuromonadales bacterium]